MPYASPIAPPSYQDTILADRRTQTSDVSSDEAEDEIIREDENRSISSLNGLLNRETQEIVS